MYGVGRRSAFSLLGGCQIISPGRTVLSKPAKLCACDKVLTAMHWTFTPYTQFTRDCLHVRDGSGRKEPFSSARCIGIRALGEFQGQLEDQYVLGIIES
jgi:hypothetical protein